VDDLSVLEGGEEGERVQGGVAVELDVLSLGIQQLQKPVHELVFAHALSRGKERGGREGERERGREGGKEGKRVRVLGRREGEKKGRKQEGRTWFPTRSIAFSPLTPSKSKRCSSWTCRGFSKKGEG